VVELFSAAKEVPLSRIINDAKVDDHHALIPTDIEHDLDSFSEAESKIFDLIAKRFLAVFYPPAKYARTTIITEVEGESFRTKGKTTLEAGWRAVYGVEPDEPKAQDEDQGEGGELPALKEGMVVRCAEAESESKETKPPPRYTEATLLSAMETAGKLVEDDELGEAMKERGLGTPATRANIIEKLIGVGYVYRAGRELEPLPTGMQVIKALEGFDSLLTRPDLTGEWEKKLLDIEHGKGDRDSFMREIADFARLTVDEIGKLDKDAVRPPRAELGLCPRCGEETGKIIRENRLGYGCTSWNPEGTGCGFVIWKKKAGRLLTPEIARQMLADGRTEDVLSGFKSKAGRNFRARLILKDEGKVGEAPSIEFEFPEQSSPKQSDKSGDKSDESAGEAVAARE
jgi:DNA topoisomerase-3